MVSKDKEKLLTMLQGGDDPEALLREAATIFGVGSMRQLNIAMTGYQYNW